MAFDIEAEEVKQLMGAVISSVTQGIRDIVNSDVPRLIASSMCDIRKELVNGGFTESEAFTLVLEMQRKFNTHTPKS